MTAKPLPPRVPGWEILSHIGAGGMGDVWKARRADGVLAAVKVVKPVKRLTSGEVASLFRREALACLNVDHPNLVRALDAGTTADGRAYLALEFVEGRTLDAVLDDGGALPEPRVVDIGAALARALGKVHHMGLVHRDVKPRNVMLVPGGGVKLLDFGLVLESADGAAEHGMGTHGFAAPEVLAGETAGARSDFYSLGATLAAAATGESPRRGRSFADRTLPETADGRTLSPGFRQVVARLLKSDPGARYGSAAEIVLDLEAIAAGERPLGAILGSAGARAVRRGPRIAAAFAGVAAATAGIWWIATRPGDSPHVDAPPPPVEPSRPPARDPKLEAAEVFVQSFPDDFVRGRELIAEADTPSLTGAERASLEQLRRACDERLTAAAEREYAERERRVAAEIVDGDVPRARQVASEWPVALRESPLGRRLAELAEGVAARLAGENRALATDVEDAATSATIDAWKLDVALAKIDEALARPAFDGDSRERLAAARPRLVEVRKAALDAQVGAKATAGWREAIAAHVTAPSAERFRAALDAARALPSSDANEVKLLSESWARAESRLTSRVAALAGKPWCGPRGESIFCGVAQTAPSVEEIFLSPLWAQTGGRLSAVLSATKGPPETAAWLFARGVWNEAREVPGLDGAFADWFAEAPRAVASGTSACVWPPGVDVGLALRDVAAIVEWREIDDPIAVAWAAATNWRAGRTAVAVARNPDKSVGRNAFLDGDLAKAAESLTRAAAVDPRDAEIAALRGRVYLLGVRTLPTAPACLAAFSEGRRAWDLDPKLPAGPVLAADAGIALVELAGGAVAARARPVVAAACEAADAMGRADARMLLFAGEHRLDEGRAPEGAALLRRAAKDSPDSAPAALLLARAEHVCGRADAARTALRRARDLLGGKLPETATELARTLGL